jgi:hypothetical protein
VEHQLADELPTPRADLDTYRERTGIRLEGSAGPLKARLSVTADGQGNSPTSVCVAVLLLTAAGSVPAGILAIAGGLMHMAAVPLVLCTLAVFSVVFLVGVALAFRRPVASVRPAELAPLAGSNVNGATGTGPAPHL